MKPQLTVLSESEINRIHSGSLKLLDEPGFEIGSPDIYRLLLENGALKGERPNQARITKLMVKKALSTCPADYLVAYLNGERQSIRIHRHYSTCLVDPKMNDCAGGNTEPVLKDCIDAARLADACENVTMPYKMDLHYADVPDEDSLLQSNLALFENFTRHVICGPMNPEDARIWIEMAEIMASGPLNANPVISMLISPSSPMTLHNDVL